MTTGRLEAFSDVVQLLLSPFEVPEEGTFEVLKRFFQNLLHTL